MPIRKHAVDKKYVIWETTTRQNWDNFLPVEISLTWTLTMLKVTTALSIASAENTKENTATVGSETVLPLQSVKVNSPLTFQGFGTLPFTINHNCKIFYVGRQNHFWLYGSI